MPHEKQADRQFALGLAPCHSCTEYRLRHAQSRRAWRHTIDHCMGSNHSFRTGLYNSIYHLVPVCFDDVYRFFSEGSKCLLSQFDADLCRTRRMLPHLLFVSNDGSTAGNRKPRPIELACRDRLYDRCALQLLSQHSRPDQPYRVEGGLSMQTESEDKSSGFCNLVDDHHFHVVR